MKNLLKAAFALLFINCNAQIIDLDHQGAYRHYPQGAYFKDINDYLEPFTGTFLYTNGNASLKIVLDVKVKDNGRYAEDLIYGGYEYKVNNTVISNTLPETLPINTYASNYYIYGNSTLLNDSPPPCTSCVPNEKRLYLSIKDTQCSFYRKLIIKREVVNGQVQIKVTIIPLGTVAYKYNEPEPVISFALPAGEYTLIKQ
jgi:hypothetical protein